ncbi:E3 ubiquitin-protein ligase GW2-like [Typha latifolia]|uniref:E3 ubiquitin-protein ligase GW2-like n=1 Tax=Typha latifolia TaxID=4733 RepID=UPI003C2DCA2D
MGNKVGKGRQMVDEKYTRPQGLYQHLNIDEKKLRKLVLYSKIAPCYPGKDDCAPDLEECPICFLYYPSLNRSVCCSKSICTECFLQVKLPQSTRSAKCPFCKTTNFSVEYRGVKTKEEKGMEQLEEQRFIEAQIRMQQQELQDEAKKMKNKEVPSQGYTTQGNQFVACQPLCPVPESTYPSPSRLSWDDNFDPDLEDMMVRKAIWLSMQDKEALRNPCYENNVLPLPPSEHHNFHAVTPAELSSAGFACGVEALAAHQHMNRERSATNGSNSSAYSMLRQSDSLSHRDLNMTEHFSPKSWVEVSPSSRSEMTGVGTSYADSNTTVDASADYFLPESFEEQMMLAMAISLAEAPS